MGVYIVFGFHVTVNDFGYKERVSTLYGIFDNEERASKTVSVLNILNSFDEEEYYYEWWELNSMLH